MNTRIEIIDTFVDRGVKRVRCYKFVIDKANSRLIGAKGAILPVKGGD